jgi:hypothetical protein
MAELAWLLELETLELAEELILEMVAELGVLLAPDDEPPPHPVNAQSVNK